MFRYPLANPRRLVAFRPVTLRAVILITRVLDAQCIVLIILILMVKWVSSWVVARVLAIILRCDQFSERNRFRRLKAIWNPSLHHLQHVLLDWFSVHLLPVYCKSAAGALYGGLRLLVVGFGRAHGVGQLDHAHALDVHVWFLLGAEEGPMLMVLHVDVWFVKHWLRIDMQERVLLGWLVLPLHGEVATGLFGGSVAWSTWLVDAASHPFDLDLGPLIIQV